MTKISKIFSLCIVFILLFALPVMGNIVDESSKYISSETIITEDNVYEVLDYVGLDSSALIKSDKPVIHGQKLTVGELQDVIERYNNMPNTIIDINDNTADYSNIKELEHEITNSSYPVTTVHKDTRYGSYEIRYSASGKYYTEPHGPYNTYWMEALGGNIRVQDTDFGISAKIEKINTLTNALKNAGMASSYLQLSYDYTVGIYLITDWGDLLKITENHISGYSNFDTSYI